MMKDCPFSEFPPIACDRADCWKNGKGCLVRIEAQQAEAQRLYEAWKEQQRCIGSGAER